MTQSIRSRPESGAYPSAVRCLLLSKDRISAAGMPGTQVGREDQLLYQVVAQRRSLSRIGGVVLVHVLVGLLPDQPLGKGGRDRGAGLADADLSVLDLRQEALQRRQVEIVLKARPPRLDQNRESPRT